MTLTEPSGLIVTALARVTSMTVGPCFVSDLQLAVVSLSDVAAVEQPNATSTAATHVAISISQISNSTSLLNLSFT